MRFVYASLLLGLLGISSSLYAHEVSLLSGFYNSAENTPGFKQQTVSVGGRYGLSDDESRNFWFVDAGFSSTSYSGDNAPDGGTGLTLGGGQMYFLRNFGKFIHSFISWSAGYESGNSADTNSKTESSGIYYAGNAGFRFDFSKSLFIDIEAQLFRSSLTRNVKTTNTTSDTTQETDSIEVYAKTFSGADSLKFGLGMKF